MAPQVFARRLTLIVAVVLAITPTATFAADPSPRRQAELDALVARRQTARQRKARAAAQHAAETAYQVREAQAYEMAMAQSFALAQLAAQQREFQMLQFGRTQDVSCRGGSRSFSSCPQPVIGVAYPQFSTPYLPEPSRTNGSAHPAATTGPGAGHMVLRHH